uniref:Uncharacterized protein n=1 Tax=Rhizophora mucronata TaxID=61149 RepID=A0A2P2PW69_RHIMU
MNAGRISWMCSLSVAYLDVENITRTRLNIFGWIITYIAC